VNARRLLSRGEPFFCKYSTIFKYMLPKNTRFFITGATGFIGANLVRRLIKDGYKNIGVLVRQDTNWWRLKDVKSKLKIFKGDVAQSARLAKILKQARPEIIVHLANAGVYGGKSVNEAELLKINFFGLVNLLEVSKNIRYKLFINTGSSSEYGQKNVPMRERDTCLPESDYAITKLMATEYASFFARNYKKPIITLRIFSPFGPWDDGRRLISQTAIRLLRKEPLKLGDPRAVRDYIYVEDVVDLYLASMRERKSFFGGEILNVGRGQEISVQEVVEYLKSILEPKLKLRWGSYSGNHPESSHWQADMRLARKTLKNWRPRHSVREGLKATADWFQKNQSLYRL